MNATAICHPTKYMSLDEMLYSIAKIHTKMQYILLHPDDYTDNEYHTEMRDLAKRLCELTLVVRERVEKE